MTHRHLLEQAYFHTGNSGITVEIHENSDRSGMRDYSLTVRHGAFGYGSEFTTPIMGSDYATVLSQMMARTAATISNAERDRKIHQNHSQGSIEQINMVRDGQRWNPIYESYVTSQWGTTRYLIGYSINDANSGDLVRIEMKTWVVS